MSPIEIDLTRFRRDNNGLIYEISDEDRDRLKEFLDPDLIISDASEHSIWKLTLDDEVLNDKKDVLGFSKADPPSSQFHDSTTYTVVLKKTLMDEDIKKSINLTKKTFGIDVARDEVRYWAWFHELGHTFRASETHHTGCQVTDDTKTKEFKLQQERIAEEYALKRYTQWKNRNR